MPRVSKEHRVLEAGGRHQQNHCSIERLDLPALDSSPTRRLRLSPSDTSTSVYSHCFNTSDSLEITFIIGVVLAHFDSRFYLCRSRINRQLLNQLAKEPLGVVLATKPHYDKL
jgi:hypothetical protein